jgi:AraC-like DNA-binding protein
MLLAAPDIRVLRTGSESELGRWTSCEWFPEPFDPLAAVLDGVWYFDGVTALARERHLPTGRYEAIVQFDTPHRPVEGEPGIERYASACIAGLQLGPRVIEAPAGRVRVLGIRLTPSGAYAVLGHALEALNERTCALRDVVGMEGTELEARLHAQHTGEARVALAVAWVRNRLAVAPPAHAAIAWSARSLEADATHSIAELHEQSGLGRGAFVRLFREQIGTTPKRFARLIRVREAAGMMKRGGAPLGRIAQDAGFYDQAHLSTEFRELTGLAPSDFLRSLQYPGSLSIAEPG